MGYHNSNRTSYTGGHNSCYVTISTSVAKFYVPHNSVSAYKTATYWSDYASSIVGYDFE